MIEVSELSVLSHLTYVAYNRSCDVVEKILKNGEAPFVQSYKNIAFLNANRLFKPEIKENYCGFIASNERDIVIAIRGTENLDDFFYDLLALTDSEKDSIHLGFSMYVDSFFQQVQEILAEFQDQNKNLYITGHSLGGSAALVLLKKLKDSDSLKIFPENIQAFAFGSPPVSTAEIYINDNIHHYRNEGDFIPHLPQLIGFLIKRIPFLERRLNEFIPSLVSNLEKYSHNENEDLWMIGYDGSILRDNPTPDFQPVRQIARSLVIQNPLKSLNQVRKNKESKNVFRAIIHSFLKTSLEEHRASLYVQRLFSKQKPSWFTEFKIDKSRVGDGGV